MGQEPDVVQGLRSLFARGGFDLTVRARAWRLTNPRRDELRDGGRAADIVLDGVAHADHTRRPARR